MRYVVVGGVAAGASSAARLRRLNEEAEIIVIDKGEFVSFSNCSLPYHLSSVVANHQDLVLMTPEKLKSQYNLDVRVKTEVISVNADQSWITLKNLDTNQQYNLDFDKLVLAPGAKAITPPFPGRELMPHFTLKTVPDTVRITKHLNTSNAQKVTVIGGGFIGIETAENLRLAGYQVTLIEAGEQILAPVDFEMASFAENELRQHQVELIKGKFVKSFTANSVVLDSGQEVETDAVILALGVQPDTDFLKKSAIALDERGFILTNENHQTNYPNIYAGGDAILVKHHLTGEHFPLALAGPANKQGRAIADHISGILHKPMTYLASSVIKVFDYTVASVGLNEKQLQSLNYEYQVAYGAPGDRVGIMPGAKPVYIKLIFERASGKLLGGQAVSKGVADKRIDVLATAIKAGLDVYDLASLELTYAPSFATGKDAINKLGYIASNLVDEQFKQVPFTKIYDLLAKDIQLIDVRSSAEHEKIHIKGAVNIPMDKMRDNLAQIDKTKPVYVHCASGQRSYNMVMMLQAHGYDAYNVAGSMVFLANYERAKCFDDESRTKILVEKNNS